MSQYLVASRPLHDHGRPHSQWRHRQHGHNHPLWPSELGIHAQDEVFFIRDAFKDLVDALWTQQDFLFLRILVDVFPLGKELQAGAANARLVASTATVTL